MAVALVRGFARSRTGELGNFWADPVRGTVRILLPISVIGALVLVARGAIQNFSGIHAVGQFTGTIVFLLAVVTLKPFAIYAGADEQTSLIVLTALLVCFIPTTIGALLSAIGIAGMDRLVQRNVLTMSGRAVEATGGTVTIEDTPGGGSTTVLGLRTAGDPRPSLPDTFTGRVTRGR